MQTHITPNNKLASLGTIGLLFLAGIAGMVFLLPYSPAHAASPTVALSTISGGVQTAATSGTVGSSITITGDGFASNAPIEISSTSGTNTVSWFITNTVASVVPNNCVGAFASAYGGIGTANSLTVRSGATACLTTTATGMFETTVVVPALPGGPQTIVVSDGTNTVSTAFTVTPSVSITFAGNNFGFPEEAVSGTIAVTGFGSAETVTVTSTAFTTTSFTCTTGSTLTGGSSAISWGANKLVSGTSAGTATCTPGVAAVADTTSGAKTVTATGGTSALTASTTYTINPWVSFSNSVGSTTTTFSFIGTSPSSVVISGHGFPATAIPASSITIGGVTTNHQAVTPGTSGAFSNLIVSPTANVPYGVAPVVIGGTTFSYAAGNIALGSGVWGGVLISSVQGNTGSTGVATTDKATYLPGGIAASTTSSAPAQNQIGFFGFGFCPVASCSTGGTLTVGQPAGAAYCNSSLATSCASGDVTYNGLSANHVDNNGAFFATTFLGDTPWSSAASPTTAASYTATVTQPVAGTNGPASILSPSFGAMPWITGLSSVVDYTTLNADFTAHGFSANDVLTMTIGATAMVSGGTCTAVNGGCLTTGNGGSVPDLAGGLHNVVVTGSLSGQSVTVTGGATYDPRITASSGCSTTCTLSVQAGQAGSTTILRTGTTFGVHGLLGNTAYRIVWNGQTGTYYGFTSTATGGIPVPGVQITIPSDTSGLHIIDIQAASSFGTSSIYANNLVGDYFDNDAGLSTTQNTQFGDMLFQESTSLIAAPTVVNVGGSTAISGTGLAASTLYDLGVSQAGTGDVSVASATNPPTTCSLTGTGAASAPVTIAGSFTSTSSGTVPSSVSVAITDMPTVKGLEQGTLYCVFAQTAAGFGLSSATGVAEFELQASASVNMTSAPSGHNAILSAHGLAASTGYNILFAPYACGNSGSICGTVVGAVLTNGQGEGSSTFTVPSTIQTSAGSQPVTSGAGYTVELQAVGSASVALASPPTVTVGSVSSTSCNTTTCMTVSGTPAQTTQGAYTGVTSTFTNNSNAPVTAFVYAVVHNALGQTVDISTATVTASAGGSATAFNALFGLPPGTYSVTIFATSSSGTAISGTSTATVTIA